MPGKKDSQGYVTLERTVPKDFHGICTNAGWKAKRVTQADTHMHDDDISRKYGNNRSILLTHDKDAHKHNVEGGFKGFVVYDNNFTEAELPLLNEELKQVMTNNTANTLAGKQVMIKKDGHTHKKVK